MNSLSHAYWFKSLATDSLSIVFWLSLVFRRFFWTEPFQSCFRNKDQSWRYFVCHRSIENFKRYNFSSGHVCQFLFSERRRDHFVVAPTRASTGQLAHRNSRLTFDFRVCLSKERSRLDLLIPKWLGRLDLSALCKILRESPRDHRPKKRLSVADFFFMSILNISSERASKVISESSIWGLSDFPFCWSDSSTFVDRASMREKATFFIRLLCRFFDRQKSASLPFPGHRSIEEITRYKIGYLRVSSHRN